VLTANQSQVRELVSTAPGYGHDVVDFQHPSGSAGLSICHHVLAASLGPAKNLSFDRLGDLSSAGAGGFGL